MIPTFVPAACPACGGDILACATTRKNWRHDVLTVLPCGHTFEDEKADEVRLYIDANWVDNYAHQVHGSGND